METLNYSSVEKLDKLSVIKALLDDQEFIYVVKTASPTLYANLSDLENKSKKKIDNILQTLLKYYVRFYSRPTPFSLFSSVAIGSFKQTDLPIISKEKKNSRVRICEEWLNGYTNYLESDLNLLPFLELKTNDLIEEESSLYYLAYYTGSDMKENSSIKEVSLKKTDLLQYTLNYFKWGRNVEDYLEVLNNQEVNIDEGIKYIQNLLQKEILISNLRLSNSVEDKTKELINVLKSLGEIATPYKLLLEKIVAYINNNNLVEIEQEMRAIVDTKECFQIDSLYSEKLDLPYSLKKNLNLYAQTLYKIGILLGSGDTSMKYYLDKFVDYYGLNVGVPIKSLINDKTELGPPPTYANPSSVLDYEFYNSSSSQQRINNDFINELIYLVSITKSEEIDISSVLDKFKLKDEDLKEGSADIYISIYKDKDNYRIYPSGNIFSPFAGRTAGRFLYGLPQEEVNQFLCEQKEQLLTINPNTELINVNLNPLFPRASNVMKSPTCCDFEVSISAYHNNTKKVINLSDVFVYTDGRKIKFFSKEIDKELKFSIPHMLNHQLNSPNIYRFMLDVELYNNFSTYYFNWGVFENKPELPRVKYGNVIIQPKSWNLNLEDSKDGVEKYVDDFIEKYTLPRFLKIVDHDNYILVDLNAQYSKEILIKTLNSEKRVKLVEADELNYESILKDEEGNHFINEIVYSIYVKKRVKENEKKEITTYNPNNKEEIYPKDWCYVKLYHSISKDKKIITQNFKKFYQKIDGIGEAFYIKYSDPRPHIRLRVKSSENNKFLIQKLVEELVEDLYSQKLIYDAVYTKYKRELERYGGSEAIKYAEKVFIADSLLISNLLPLLEKKEEKSIVLMSVCIELLNEFINNEMIYKWIEKNYRVDKKYYKEFRQEIKNNENKNCTSIKALMKVLNSQIGLGWRKNLSAYKTHVSSHELYDYYISSILHMHLNRLGIHNTEEEKIINLIYFYLKEESYKQPLLMS